MTRSQPNAPTVSASGVAEGEEVPGDFSCCPSKRIPTREQWKFLGREQHWGYVFLVWVRADGKRWARWVRP